jgi:hypothetical protein
VAKFTEAPAARILRNVTATLLAHEVEQFVGYVFVGSAADRERSRTCATGFDHVTAVAPQTSEVQFSVLREVAPAAT